MKADSRMKKNKLIFVGDLVFFILYFLISEMIMSVIKLSVFVAFNVILPILFLIFPGISKKKFCFSLDILFCFSQLHLIRES